MVIKPKLVVVDIDSTLYCFLSAFQRSAARAGISVPDPVHITEWSAMEPYFSDFKNFLACVEDAYSFETIDANEPYPGCVDALHKIQDSGFEVAYYTDRAKRMEQATYDWLKAWDFPSIDNLHVCADKRNDLRQIGTKVATVIDDRPRTLIWSRYVLGLEKVFTLQHSYNRNLSDVPGVFIEPSWPLLVDTFFAEMKN